jgi:hypothetical protein
MRIKVDPADPLIREAVEVSGIADLETLIETALRKCIAARHRTRKKATKSR